MSPLASLFVCLALGCGGKPAATTPAGLRIGMSIEDLGKVLPANYYGKVLPTDLPKFVRAQTPPSDSRWSLAVLNFPSQNVDSYFVIDEGKVKYTIDQHQRSSQDRLKEIMAFSHSFNNKTVGSLLEALPKDADLRLALPSGDSLDIELPRELAKYRSFSGELSYLEMLYPYDRFTDLTLDNGRVTQIKTTVDKCSDAD